MELYFATQNDNKIKEIARMMPGSIHLRGLSDLNFSEEIPETQKTIAGNSYQKAEFIFKKFGVSVFADDTGLEVDALNNEPGVLSARYAGPQKSSEDNIQLLLKNLSGQENRKARFVTVISFIDKTGEIEYFKGQVSGIITESLSGNKGFGYDPVFRPDGYDITFAEMSLAEKNKISHRGIAFRKFIENLSNRDEE